MYRDKLNKFQTKLLVLTSLILAFVMLVYSAASLWTAHHISGTSFKEKIVQQQLFFIESIQQNISSGKNVLVQRKSENFYKTGHIKAILITDEQGQQIAGVNASSLPTASADVMVSPLFLPSGKGDQEPIAWVKVYYADSITPIILKRSLWILLGTILLSLPLVAFFTKKMSQRMSKPIERLAHSLSSGDLNKISETLQSNQPDLEEVAILHDAMSEMAQKLIEAQKKEREQAKLEALVAVASHVSHDIRSPLSAISMIVDEIENIPEYRRLMLRNATARINDIANTLLEQSKAELEPEASNQEQPRNKIKTHLLPALVDSLVSEKRVQFRDKMGIDIEAELQQGYGAFVDVDGVEIKRVISNLVNNAVEALPNQKGRVKVFVRKEKGHVILGVKDNGCGIPQHVLEKLGQKGVTHGKEGTQSGSGLGVYHAKKVAEENHADFHIESQEGLGTTFRLTFKAAETPAWFVEELILSPGQEIISMDDDVSIHGIWTARLEPLKAEHPNLVHHTFTSAEDFKRWVEASEPTSKKRLFLMDFELLNQNTTGLGLVEELGIGSESILVTSRYEEAGIQAQCARLGVRLIPKTMAALIPVTMEKTLERLDLVLIDDDVKIMHEFWRLCAETKGKNIKSFSNPQDFMKVHHTIDRRTPIYVDCNLGPETRGQDVAIEVAKKGFKEIFITTGYQPETITVPSCVRSVVSKDFPLN